MHHYCDRALELSWLYFLLQTFFKKKAYLFWCIVDESAHYSIYVFCVFQNLVERHLVDDSFNLAMHQWSIILNQEWVLEVFCVQHENLWRWWKVNLKHHLRLILHCHNDVKALWLDQRENCRLSQCVCDCISCSFRSFEQFSQELFDILHDLLIFIAFLFSDNLALLVICLNVLCSVIDDSTASSHSLHALDDLHTLLRSFCFDYFVWFRSKSRNLDDLLQCIQQLLNVFIYALMLHLMIQQWFQNLFFQNINEFLFIHYLSVATRFSRWLFEIYNCLYQ